MLTQRSPIQGSGGGLPGTGRASASFAAERPERALERQASAARFAESAQAARREQREAGFPPGERGERAATERSAEQARPSGARRGPGEPHAARATSGAPEEVMESVADAARAAPLAPVPAPAPEPALFLVEHARGQALAPPALPPAGVAPLAVPAAVLPQAAALVQLAEPGAQAAAVQDSGSTGTSGAPSAALASARTPGAPVAPGAAQPAASAALDPAIEEAAEVLRQIKAELHPGLRRVRIDLDPPELGRLVIQVALHEGRLSAVVEAQSAATLELLERQAPELRAALAQHGVAAEQVSLQLGSDPSRERGHQQAWPRGASRAGTASSDEPGRERAPLVRFLPSVTTSGVDTYA